MEPESIGKNILPCDGEAYYFPGFFAHAELEELIRSLKQDTPWQNDEVIMFGKRLVLSRKTAWYGDQGLVYTYSGIKREPLGWTKLLSSIKQRLENTLQVTFNACLLNYYASGNEGMGFHRDNEKTLVANAAIASLSLGSKRRFIFKHRITKELVQIELESGSLLVMGRGSQDNWLHALPKTKKETADRINLTFRQMQVAAK